MNSAATNRVTSAGSPPRRTPAPRAWRDLRTKVEARDEPDVVLSVFNDMNIDDKVGVTETDVNEPEEWTLLHYAALNDRPQVARLLVERLGATLNAANQYGWTPLHLAVFNNHADMVQYLVQGGANTQAATSKEWQRFPAGTKPIDVAKRQQRTAIMRMLTTPAPATFNQSLLSSVPKGFEEVLDIAVPTSGTSHSSVAQALDVRGLVATVEHLSAAVEKLQQRVARQEEELVKQRAKAGSGTGTGTGVSVVDKSRNSPLEHELAEFAACEG